VIQPNSELLAPSTMVARSADASVLLMESSKFRFSDWFEFPVTGGSESSRRSIVKQLNLDANLQLWSNSFTRILARKMKMYQSWGVLS
jgi:hypothetical protein